MDGILLVDKPAGMTSHDVVAKIRGILRQAQSQKIKDKSQSKNLSALDFKLSPPSQKVKVGHTGTLDPAAIGLMILVLGNYTKRASEFSKLDKTYEAELTLGSTSSTGDSEGIITQKKVPKTVRSDQKCPSLQEIERTLENFLGNIEQTPPIYSAIKVNGQRAYKLARAGKKPELKPRQVTVYRLQVTEYNYPIIKLITEVSSGTYIRSLAKDIGKKLGTGAYMSALRRTKVGKFEIEDAISLDRLDLAKLEQGLSDHL